MLDRRRLWENSKRGRDKVSEKSVRKTRKTQPLKSEQMSCISKQWICWSRREDTKHVEHERRKRVRAKSSWESSFVRRSLMDMQRENRFEECSALYNEAQSPRASKKQPRTTAYPKATLKTHLQLSLLNVVLILKNVKRSELQAHRRKVVMIINATNDYVLQKMMKPECRAGVCYEVIERVPITFDQ